MTPFEESMSAPKIEVIDAAIECLQRVRPGRMMYSCSALRRFRQLCLDAAK